MPFETTTIESPVNTGAQGLFAGLAAWLAQVGAIAIQDVDVWRENSPTYTGAQRMRILFQRDVDYAVEYKAYFFSSGSVQQAYTGANAANQYNALMQGGEAFRPLFYIDVTAHGRRYASAESFIIIGVDTDDEPGLQGQFTAVFAEPTGSIAAGAAGNVNLLDARGEHAGTATVRNVGGQAWPANQRTYVVLDVFTGELVAVPTCSTDDLTPLVPPTLTTTTEFPSAAYIPQTKPVEPT